MQTYLSLIVILAFGFIAQAEPMTLSIPKEVPLTDAAGETVMQLPDLENRNHVFGQIRLEGMDYLSPIPDSPELTYSKLLTARLSALRERPSFDLAADITGGTYFTARQSYFVVHEIFAAYKTPSTTSSLGRRKVGWSEMDRRWQLGLWQPRYAIDALRPEEEGLTGAFFDYNTENFQVVGFGSPIFIPSMGPDIREEGGSLKSDSRWYRTPSSQVNFNTRINSISYALDIPDEMKLARNGGGALMTRLGSKERGPWAVGSAGYMPVNDLVLKRRIFKSIAADNVDVTVSPDVVHHQIASVDAGYSFESTQVSVSYLEDKPDTKLPDPEWAIQKLEPIKAYSAAIDYKVENFFSRTVAFGVGYLRVVGGRIQDVTNDGSPDDFLLFDQRLIFTNAINLSAEGELGRIYSRALVGRFKYLYDYDQRGSMVNTEVLFYPTQKVAVLLGADILGVQDENYKPSSFLNSYRANDRIYGGMTYVF